MSSLRFTEQALSNWMRCGGSHSEIVISSRMRIARNLEHLPFPLLASAEQAEEALEQLAPVFQGRQRKALAASSCCGWMTLMSWTKRCWWRSI